MIRVKSFFAKLTTAASKPFVSSRVLSRPSVAEKIRHACLQDGNGAKKIVGYWLLGSSALVFGIVVLGGLTRLTESGLSMVDWSLVHFKAPQTEAEWEDYFEKYKQFPEYQM